MNKKNYEGKKAHAENRTQTSSGLTAKFKFPGHPQKLVRHGNISRCIKKGYFSTLIKLFLIDYDFIQKLDNNR
jgi:hypothetical protein